MPYVIPHPASLLFKEYKTGFSSLSLQAKESKHTGIKAWLAANQPFQVYRLTWKMVASHESQLCWGILFTRTSPHAIYVHFSLWINDPPLGYKTQ